MELALCRVDDLQQEHGHCNVSGKYEANPQLGDWVLTVSNDLVLSCCVIFHTSANYIAPTRAFILQQHRRFNKGHIPVERIAKLNQLGFEWDGRKTVGQEN